MKSVSHVSHGQTMAGITLIELMIVVSIVAILAAIAYPSYREHVRKSNRAEGQAMLQNAAALQERFYSNNNTYTNNHANLGFTTDYDGDGNTNETENDYYRLTIACNAAPPNCTSYTLTATAQGGQSDDSKCATMTLDNSGLKGGTNADCWP